MEQLIDRCTGESPEAFNAIIAANERAYHEECKRAFYRDFARLQADLPIIEKNEAVTFRDGRTGVYAPNDEIQEIIGPLLREHKFTLSFSVTYPAGMVKVVGELMHVKGYSKTSEYEARVDFSGGKTDAQGRGSVISYGQRYCTVPLLNLILRGADNDGSTHVANTLVSPELITRQPQLCSAARRGSGVLDVSWAVMPRDEREGVSPDDWRNLKALAAMVDRLG